MSRRVAAIVAIVGNSVAVAAAVYVFIDEFPRGIVVLAAILAAAVAGWFGLVRRGRRRRAGFVLAALLLAIAAAVLLAGSDRWLLAVIAIAAAIGVGAARISFKPHNLLPPATLPTRPVVFINPRSGDGHAARFGLAEEADRRGLETSILEPGGDLEELVRSAVDRGADGLAMAGGDGSQALVAAIAAEHELPFVCIPAGTRNHFALDLGVDREDVIGALDALAPGARERIVDLAEVNGRTFVNNVSLGAYAEAVSHKGYRESKLGTLIDSVADNLGPDADPTHLRWRDPDGTEQTSVALMLVTNNTYRLGPALGAGTRPRLDVGELGIVDFVPPEARQGSAGPPWRQFSFEEIDIDAGGRVPLGIDGEAVTLDSPLRFRSRPAALRVLIAPRHPGASPASSVPAGPLQGIRALALLAIHGDRAP
ncbi:MAG TPA: diacylglycerol kinase family protein [Solirubrobacterales bacterium]|nr:diacylglycerol kinase family protein [Solirubrobacterales bacterium]